jgi:ABC-type multidrug transport system fused ATPase/permease subunit
LGIEENKKASYTRGITMEHILYFLRQINSHSGKILYLNLLAMVAFGLLEGIAILLLVPMISMSGIIETEQINVPFFEMFNFLQMLPASFVLPVILGGFLILVVGQNLLQRQIMIHNTVIQQSFLRYIRVETYELLLRSSWNYFINKRKSDLINILTSEVGRASSATNSFLQFLSSLIVTLIQICLAFILAPSITTFVIFCGMILILFNRRFLKYSMTIGNKNLELARTYIGGVTDQINGFKEIKSNIIEDSRLRWFNSITNKMQEEQVEYKKIKTTSQLYYKIASSVLIVLCIYFSISLFKAQAGQLILIIAIFSKLWPRVAGIQGAMEQIYASLPSLKAVKDLHTECNEFREFDTKINDNIEPFFFQDLIQCQNVYFRYQTGGNKFALEDININIPSNKMIAFVGPSGAGKSTLIDLLMGLNRPEKGQVLIDGKPISNEILSSLRRSISYVPQDPFLFNTSIRENLTLFNELASDQEIWEALDFSSAAEFVEKLPLGLDTYIGDRGIKLSGGERQRIVLARAILRNPTILILDEATSALDSKNENKIQESLEKLKGRMTILVIAHRLSTIQNADLVFVMENGKVIQKGGFNQLANDKRKMFSQLLSNQIKALH